MTPDADPTPATAPAFTEPHRYRPARKARSTMFWVILISVAVHVIAGLALGSYSIYKYTRPPEAIFESPPPAVKVPPQNVEYRVQMQQMQRESQRPQNQVATQVDQLLNQQVQNVAQNVTSLANPALAGTPVVSSGARGGGRIGGGSGIGFGVSAVNFFGIQKSGERVVFIVDAGASMVEPERGDFPGYDRVKAELVGMVDGLSPGTFFNVIVFQRGVDVYRNELVVATNENKQGVAAWIGPYWRLRGVEIERRGTFRNNYRPNMTDEWPSDGGSSRLDLALVAAMEMQADLIFMITDGTPSIQKGWTEAQQAALVAARAVYERERAQYVASAKGKREMEDYQKRRDEWAKKRTAETEARKKRGLPPVVREGGGYAPSVPGPRPPGRNTGYYSGQEIIAYARRMAAVHYGDNSREWPSINPVGYSADKNAETFLRRFPAAFPNSTMRNLGKFSAETKF
jgi:hypothetical protein